MGRRILRFHTTAASRGWRRSGFPVRRGGRRTGRDGTAARRIPSHQRWQQMSRVAHTRTAPMTRTSCSTPSSEGATPGPVVGRCRNRGSGQRAAVSTPRVRCGRSSGDTRFGGNSEARASRDRLDGSRDSRRRTESLGDRLVTLRCPVHRPKLSPLWIRSALLVEPIPPDSASGTRNKGGSMHRYASSVLLAALLIGAVAPAALAQGATGATEQMSAVAASSITWTEAAVPGFPAGMKIAVIQGKPDSAGLYTLRLSFPDGYRFPPHWHPMAEHLTVLSGTLQLAMGERADESKLKAYAPGDFLFMPARKAHFGGARGFTVVQLHGQGPFAINLVETTSR